MYEQLKILEAMILDIKAQYHKVSTELQHLKNQPKTDDRDLDQLQAQRDNSIAAHERAQQQLTDLDNRYQSLAEAHHMLGEEHEELQNQIEELQHRNTRLEQQNQLFKQQAMDIKKINHELQEKNQLAAERTQVVLERLTQIDQMDLDND